MSKRFITIWFRHLTTDWLTIRRPELKNMPFVLTTLVHGRMVIKAVNALAQTYGIEEGMVLADARAIAPSLQVFDEKPGLPMKLLKALALWCIRYTPVTAVDAPDGLVLDVTGCAHLWGGERPYLKEIVNRLRSSGYNVRAAMAGTIGTAWAISRFGKISPIIDNGAEAAALLPLPPAALRLEQNNLQRLQKLGLNQISHFIRMPRSVLRRRFGQDLLLKLALALGNEDEIIQPIEIQQPYQERLHCMEPIATYIGIEIALKRLLEQLCARLQKENKGLRKAILKSYRLDGKIEQVEIGTNRASHNTDHLFKLFETTISSIEPDLGIELFTLEAQKVEDALSLQQTFWNGSGSIEDISVAELLDRIAGKIGANNIHRYLPDEHHWPERSVKKASSMEDKPAIPWRTDRPRPMQLLRDPERVDVSAPIPDYPPMNFRYKGKLHTIKKADGPERIEREWWIEKGLHRDYYCVEDEEGRRYWLFRSGHYDGDKTPHWFIHGFFA